MTNPKVILLILLVVIAITGCISNESVAKVEPTAASHEKVSVSPSIHTPTYDDRFHFGFEFGVNKDTVVDTKEKILRVQASSDLTTSVSDFQLNEKDMTLIYEEAINQGLLRDQDKMEESVTCNKKPYENYNLSLYHEGSTYHYEWNECDKDKQNQMILKDEIMNILQKNDSYVQLKEDIRYAE